MRPAEGGGKGDEDVVGRLADEKSHLGGPADAAKDFTTCLTAWKCSRTGNGHASRFCINADEAKLAIDERSSIEYFMMAI